jgi:hypothetical protein
MVMLYGQRELAALGVAIVLILGRKIILSDFAKIDIPKTALSVMVAAFWLYLNEYLR